MISSYGLSWLDLDPPYRLSVCYLSASSDLIYPLRGITDHWRLSSHLSVHPQTGGAPASHQAGGYSGLEPLRGGKERGILSSQTKVEKKDGSDQEHYHRRLTHFYCVFLVREKYIVV